MLENCRVCYGATQGTNAKNLFEIKQSILLQHLELLTGEWLSYENDAPSYICICCEQDLEVAIALRERCIKTQRILRNRNICASSTSETIEIKLEENLIKFENEHSETNQCADFYADSALDCNGEEQVDDIEVSVNDDEVFDERNDNFIMTSLDIKEEEIQSTEDENELEAQPVDSPDGTSPETPEEIPAPVEHGNLNHCRISTEKAKGRRNITCDQCGRHFKEASNLKLHLIRHSGIKNYECEECKAKFYTAHLLKRHSLIHTNSPAMVPCQYCDRKFISNNLKLQHERSHFMERKFNCQLCDKSFFTRDQQKAHGLVHTRTRKYHCELCDQHFLRKTHLERHYHSKTHKNLEQQRKKF